MEFMKHVFPRFERPTQALRLVGSPAEEKEEEEALARSRSIVPDPRRAEDEYVRTPEEGPDEKFP